MSTRCGFVAIVGRPNVGKSTLLNRLIGEKLAGVSPKPQTTRGVIRGILTRPEGQIIFLDTPGHHRPADALGQHMLHGIEQSLASVDLLYFMTLPFCPGEAEKKLLDLIRPRSIPVFLLINQVDKYPKPQILPALEEYQKLFPFREMIPVSAKHGDQVDIVVQKTFENLPEGDKVFPDDQISDQQERLFVEEMIREKIFRCTSQEVPYDANVVIESFKERSETLVAIEATIVVEKDSQKAIMIGEGGSKLKEIGQKARQEIEKFLGRKVFLKLWVKTFPDWKNQESFLRRMGFDQ
ncbi:MAG: GTPase Era [Candidatus Omnitrophica bacterium]|nr:GTPase Era [Candidatus Omnitrophota bacterium]